MSATMQHHQSTTSTSSSMSSGGTDQAVERRCENADCNAAKLVAMVPKRKTSQFVIEPVIMEKPMLVNGFTTVFQVDGDSAKLSDLKSISTATGPKTRTIYRIVPNTHAHIVNYVVVDPDGESLRKINEGDPATMRKLLNSQKSSADQMLKKLISGGSLGANVFVSGAGPSGSSATNPINKNISILNMSSEGGSTPPPIQLAPSPAPTLPLLPPSLPILPPMPLQQQLMTTSVVPTIVSFTSIPSSVSSPGCITVPSGPPSTGYNNTNTTQIQLPMRMHPNLKITAVSSADTFSSSAPTQQLNQISQQTSQMPIITPVPLANLQSVPMNIAGSNKTTSISSVNSPIMAKLPPLKPMETLASTSTPTTSNMDKPVFSKMQAEIEELRRTVAFLAEEQKKNAEQPKRRPAKRPRSSGGSNFN